MRIVGLTGSIGMGKSTVAAMLHDLGVPVFDADAEVHRLQGPGGALVAAIETAFPGTTDGNGVDRQALGARVLSDDVAMSALEAIVHPAVADSRQAFLTRNAGAPLVVFDVPLLLEKGGDAPLDAVWVVSAPPDVQRARVLARPGMTVEKFEAILARQMPDAEKRSRADVVIDTGVSLNETRARLAALVTCIKSAEGQ